jgi:hypothetical protein
MLVCFLNETGIDPLKKEVGAFVFLETFVRPLAAC